MNLTPQVFFIVVIEEFFFKTAVGKAALFFKNWFRGMGD